MEEYLKQDFEKDPNKELNNNIVTYRKFKEDRKMNKEAIGYVFKEEIEEMKNASDEASIEKMLKDNVSTTNIQKWLSVPVDKIIEVAKRMGMETLAI